MTFLEAILLGILQGLTEFLPVSSSGHLVLAQQFLGLQEPLVFFDVMLHVGTLAAVLVAYRDAIKRLVIGGLSTLGDTQFWRQPRAMLNTSAELKFIGLILLGSIPTGIIAVLFKTQLESLFDEVRLVSIMLILTGFILQLPRLRREKADNPAGQLKTWHAPLIGIAQGCAITPGISRSGTTISLGLFLGIPAKTAAEYSFLLSIPAILGAVAAQNPGCWGHHRSAPHRRDRDARLVYCRLHRAAVSISHTKPRQILRVLLLLHRFRANFAFNRLNPISSDAPKYFFIVVSSLLEPYRYCLRCRTSSYRSEAYSESTFSQYIYKLDWRDTSVTVSV